MRKRINEKGIKSEMKKNNFIVLKILLCLILIGATACGICAYRFGRVTINVSSETGAVKVDDISCKVSGLDKEVEFSPKLFPPNTFYGYAPAYQYEYCLYFELDNQPYEVHLTHCTKPDSLTYVANVRVIVNVLEDGRIEIKTMENGEPEWNKVYERGEELYIYMGCG